MNSELGLVGRKLGMTQLFDENGTVMPVTVVQTGPCTVVGVKTEDGRDGYNAIQLAFETKKANRTNKADAGQFKGAGLDAAPRIVQEIRVTKADAEGMETGKVLGVQDVFTEGQRVDVTGVSKGKGFQGVMKRYNFAGFERSHGVHEFFRHGGSIGTRLTPGHVLKGKKMPGQMGNEQVTMQNLVVARVDAEQNLVYLLGGVPGAKGSIVTVRKAVKS
jgi:large subunit ribosomal protein L3